MCTTIYKPYLEIVKNTPRYGGVRQFIDELDIWQKSNHTEKPIYHNILFRLFKSRVDFPELWEMSGTDLENPELELAVRYLSYDSKKEWAEVMIRAWWNKHQIEGDEITLMFALEEAWKLTEEKRRNFEMRKEEERTINRRPKTKDRVLAYLADRNGTAAAIGDALQESRKCIGMHLRRMKGKEVRKLGRGLYALQVAA